MSQSFPPPGPPSGPPEGPGGPGEGERLGGPLAPLPQARPPRRSPVALGVLVGVVVFAVIVAGFAGWRLVANDDDPDAAPSGDDTPASTPTQSATPQAPPTASLARFYAQKLHWKKCDRDVCARLEVPLDYAHPEGRTLKLAVLRVPAQGRRVGSLVVNPGGPGGSGVNYAAAGSLQFGQPLSDAYDIVGFDPRGVGESAPLQCISTSELDRLLAFDPDPDTQAERDRMDQLINGFGQGCLNKSGELARHMSTEEAAKDMDVLRAALGEDKLDYLGASYGTFLGATYANLFPAHVGRFVLDGAVDPAMSNAQLALEQAGGFETALRAYVTDCVHDGDCFLGDTVEAGLKRIQDFLAQVESDPLPTSDEDRPLTEGLAMMGIWLPLYVKEYWPNLSRALEQAFDEGRGTSLLALADAYSSRGPDGYTDNSMEALYAVNCLDHSDAIPTSQVPAHFAQFLKVSPTFGRAFAFSLSTCANWPVKSGHVTTALHANGAPPIVVIGTTRDPATPLRWAQALAAELSSGRLITRDGDGHTGFQRGNACVDDAVEAWLIRGKVPPQDLRC
ncbi:MAG: alpha/beta fold hydrolase [Nocardioidaceae bacterium]|nr:alpha/beta fold hydrolase [Nocardioidaceae bacterium]